MERTERERRLRTLRNCFKLSFVLLELCSPRARYRSGAARPGPETLVAQGETQFEALNTNIHIKHFLILSVDAYFLDKIVVNL